MRSIAMLDGNGGIAAKWKSVGPSFLAWHAGADSEERGGEEAACPSKATKQHTKRVRQEGRKSDGEKGGGKTVVAMMMMMVVW